MDFWFFTKDSLFSERLGERCKGGKDEGLGERTWPLDTEWLGEVDNKKEGTEPLLYIIYRLSGYK